METAPSTGRMASWKWIGLGILGVVFLVSGAMATVLWKVQPAQQDGAGGLRKITGEVNLERTLVQEIRIPFSNGDIQLSTSVEPRLAWQCSVKGERHGPLHSLEGAVLTLELAEFSGAQCAITLPERVLAKVDGQNGSVALVRPRADLEVELMNGTVSVTPDQTQNYKYDISVMNGRIDRFESSEARHAYRLNISVMNGTIGRATAGL